MALLTRCMMGNAVFWGWKCPNCERFIAVSKENGDRETVHRLQGPQNCPACGEMEIVDASPRDSKQYLG